jgi:hypothetical protein
VIVVRVKYDCVGKFQIERLTSSKVRLTRLFHHVLNHLFKPHLQYDGSKFKRGRLVFYPEWSILVVDLSNIEVEYRDEKVFGYAPSTLSGN